MSKLLNTIFILAILISIPGMVAWNTQAIYAQDSATSVAPNQNQTDRIGRVAVVGGESATLHAAAGQGADESLAPATLLTAIGRSADSQWVQVTDDNGHTGWVAAQQLILFGLTDLPVVAGSNVAFGVRNAELNNVTTPISATTTLSQTATTTPTAMTTRMSAQRPVSETTPLTATQAARITATVTLTGSGLNVRSGPGTNYAIVAKAKTGQSYSALGRNAAGDWVQIALTSAQPGWVSAQYVSLSADAARLPVVIVAPAPPAQPSAAAAPVNQPASTQALTSAASGLQGTLVFAASNGGAIYVYNLSSGALRQLTHGFDPAISPDGTQVVFTRDGDENGIYVINVDGSNEHRIRGEGDTLRSPKWSPDGNWIVFSRDSGHWNCYQQGRECVTRDALLGRLPPAIVNNPAAVAKFLAQFDLVENANWGIARVDTAGQEFRDIAAMDTARTPDWGNAGIVYQSTAGIQQTADKPDAENKAVIAGHNLQDPAWQPNGDRIVYQQKRGDHWEIFSTNPDGSGQVALTHPVTTLVDQLPSNGSPAWSPDGQYIVYLSNRGANNSAGDWRLWVMNADGSNQHPLPVNVPIAYSFNEEQMVSWGR